MQEHILIVGDREYVVNNNSDKYDRAIREAGNNASPQEILAHYDKLGGRITDKNGNEIKNGIFWTAYSKWKDEQPEYIKLVESKDKSLEDSERLVVELGVAIINHKRAFLGTLMTIAAAIIAGLFFLLITKDFDRSCLFYLVTASGTGFALFILSAAFYLASILTQESIVNDKLLKFVRASRKDFVQKIGNQITGIDSYEKYRQEKYGEEKRLRSASKVKGSSEIWFKIVSGLFIASSALLLVVFLLVTFL